MGVMVADRDRTAHVLNVRLLDDAADPITGAAFDDVDLEISYKRESDAAWTALTLVVGTLGTYVSNGFIEDSDANGNYELGIPSEAIVEGERVKWRFKKGSNDYQYGSIDYVGDEYIATGGGSGSDVIFNFNIPGSDIVASQAPRIYTKEKGIVVEFVANVDIEAIPLEVCFENSDRTDFHIFDDVDLTKSGNTVQCTLTDAFTIQEVSLNWSIRHATNHRVYGTGSLNVSYAPVKDTV